MSASPKSAGKFSTMQISAKRYFDRFVFSQKFAQIDPWEERVSRKHKHEFKPMAVIDFAPAAE